MLKIVKKQNMNRKIVVIIMALIMILGFYINVQAINLAQGEINPIYKPEWVIDTDENGKQKVYINTESKTLTVTLKGIANESQTINDNVKINYSSNVTSVITKDDITVYIDGKEASSITKILTPPADTEDVTSAIYTLTLSGFEQTTGRQAGKNFLEWAGNIAIKIAGRGKETDTYTADKLLDKFGNQSMMETDQNGTNADGTWIDILVQDGGNKEKITAIDESVTNITTTTPVYMFTDFIKPEYTYEYSTTNPDINTGTETVTVVFDVTDKYFESTALSTDTTGNLIKVIVDEDENANTPIIKALTRIKDVWYDATAGINLVDPDATGTGRKVGERYQLVITGLDREDGFSYSGPLTLSFDAGAKDASGNLIKGIIDKSGNLSTAQTITMGVNEPGGDADDEIVVDVVDPIWEVRNEAGETGKVDVTKDANGNVSATMVLIGKDKYFKESSLTADDIQIKVNGVADITSTAPDLEKSLSDVEYIKLDESGNYVETTEEDPDVIGVKYEFSVSGFKESDNTFFTNRANYNDNDETTIGRPYREYSGAMSIVIPAGTIDDETGALEKGIIDETGNLNNELEIDLEHVDTLKPEVIKVSGTPNINATNVELSTYTIVFDIVDKYMNSSSITATDTSMIHVYLDGEEAPSMTKPTTESEQTANVDKIFKEITNIETFRDDINGNGTVETSEIVGYRYTLVLSGFENPRTAINYNREYTDWSGDLSIKIDADTAKDTSNVGNDATILYGDEIETTDKTKAEHVDYVKPDATYEFDSVQDGISDVIDKNGKTYEMVFDITDKFFQTENLLISDFTILMSAEEETGDGEDGYYDLKANALIGKALEREDITNEVVVDVVNGTEVKETKVIGKRYTLRLSNLEKLQRIENNYYLDYSGSITISIPAGKITDSSGNGNDLTTITSGIDIPGGEVTDIETIDVVQPLWERTAFTTDIHAKTATMTLLGTDKYFYQYDLESGDEGYDATLANKGTLTLEEIKIYINGTEATGTISEGTKTFVDASGNVIAKLTMSAGEKLSEERLVQTEYGDGDVDTGYTTETVQYGVKYEISITDLAIDTNQIKIHLPEGSLVDQSENPNRVTEFFVYNALRTAQDDEGNWETEQTSGFLGNETIQRQNIDKIEFVSSLNGAPTIGTESAAGVVLCWDVSAVKDNSILAWAEQTTDQATAGVYTVHIGSNDKIFGNINSSYLFSYIGYSTNSIATDTISGIGLLDTRNVTTMNYMFQYCGHAKMSSLELGNNFDTRRVTTMIAMFKDTGYTSMVSLNLGTLFNTRFVEDMTSMFENCGRTAMTGLDLGLLFDTRNVKKMDGMFYGCGYTAMSSLNLGLLFDTNSVTSMNYMFSECGHNSLVSLDLGELFDTSNVINMEGMFAEFGYNALSNLELGLLFDTRSVRLMGGMFWDMRKIWNYDQFRFR